MSFFSFNLIGNAIDAFQQASSVTADNISNVATPGASRQTAVIQEAAPISGSPFYASHLGSPGTRGEGAVVSQIARIHQDSYDALFRGASSSQYQYTTQQQQLSSLQSNFGEPNNGINTAYTALQTAVTSVAASPTSVAVRLSVLTAAGQLTSALNGSSAAIAEQEITLKQQATSVVTKANGLIDQIASLNGQIRGLKAVGDNPNTYLDQRDYAIDQLSQLVKTSTSLQPNGSTLVTVAGQPLVNDTIAYHLAPPVIGSTANGAPAFVIGFANDANPLNPNPVPLGGGELAGYADVYNNKLIPYGQQLDAFASAAAGEMNRVMQAGVDLNANPGTPLFAPNGPQQTVTAATIGVAITDPTQLAVGMISTSAGSSIQALNSANNSVDTSVSLNANVTVFNPPVSTGIFGTLSISVDGITQTFNYDTNTNPPAPATTPPSHGDAETINEFVSNFNTGHFGVTASFDAASERIAFARDPSNIGAVHRALQGQNAPTPGFTITDSNTPPPSRQSQGQPATSLLEALGASAINSVPQTPQNAFGSLDNGGANALTKLFSTPVGIGSLQTTVGGPPSSGPGSVTLSEPTGGAYGTVNVGQILTIVNTSAAPPTQQDVVVTAVSPKFGTITVNSPNAIAAGDAITTKPTQTLGSSYQTLVSQMGLDVKASQSGLAAQTALAAGIDQARQSVDGINLDEETQNLLKFQSAYTAAAKTLSTINAMMQTTLGLIAGG
jgi:flagellar hook-associated protein 1 FlgK